MSPENEIAAERNKRYVEGEKLLFDIWKHLTTLSSGAILVLIALLEKLLKQTIHWRWLIVISIGSFLTSTMWSVTGMLQISISLRQSESFGKLGKATGLITLTLFGMGLLSLLIFACRNLLTFVF